MTLPLCGGGRPRRLDGGRLLAGSGRFMEWPRRPRPVGGLGSTRRLRDEKRRGTSVPSWGEAQLALSRSQVFIQQYQS